MNLESVTLKLPRDLLSGAQRVATARDVTIGHLVRQLLKREVERQLSTTSPNADASGRLLSALQALLARDITDARDWGDLARRLRPHGYEMRMVHGDAALFKSSCGTRVCTVRELGFPHAALVARFGEQMLDICAAETSSGVMPAGGIDPTRHAMLCTHIAAARSWPDLINRLAVEGMELRAMGAGLGIYIAATGRHLCNSDIIGAPYRALVERFGSPLPGHPHDMSKHLSPPDVAEPEEGLVVIEQD